MNNTTVNPSVKISHATLLSVPFGIHPEAKLPGHRVLLYLSFWEKAKSLWPHDLTVPSACTRVYLFLYPRQYCSSYCVLVTPMKDQYMLLKYIFRMQFRISAFLKTMGNWVLKVEMLNMPFHPIRICYKGKSNLLKTKTKTNKTQKVTAIDLYQATTYLT